MLVHLAVNNYAIVDHLELELAKGMTVITGETGAGKSIMLDALALTLGDRADSGAVRPGASKADLLATFDISDIPEATAWLEERDLAGEDQHVILRRVVTAEGRSRGYINGSPCPQQHLKALGEMLIDIHSQHEHQSLLAADVCRVALVVTLHDGVAYQAGVHDPDEAHQKTRHSGELEQVERDRVHHRKRSLGRIRPINRNWLRNVGKNPVALNSPCTLPSGVVPVRTY